MIHKFSQLLLLMSMISTTFLNAQECDSPSQIHTLNVNNIEATLGNAASLFDYGDPANGTFKNKSFNADAVGLFTSSFWIGGIKNSGETAFSGSTYRQQGPTIFQSGPYPQNGISDPDACTNYDQMFVVNRYHISEHQNDFGDNGQLDNPVDEILGWPGLGNPNFETIHGFSLPENVDGLAPFFDLNSDGIYNPYDGDYPLPNGVDPDILPETIVWWILNDNNQAVSGAPLGVEIQVTVWAYQCTDNEVLNNTIFSNHKVTNYGGENYQDLKFGLWTDFDLGCHHDDYMGCAPDQNTYFAYNQDPVDGTVDNDCICLSGASTFCEAPPATGVTFLNHEMSAFTYYNRGSSTPPPPPGTSDPLTAQEYHNLMSGKWIDGTPFSVGGDGYDLLATQLTPFAFPGDPILFNEWSMQEAALEPGDRRVIGSVNIGNWTAQQSFSVDMAFASFQNPDLNVWGQVGHLLTQVEEIQSIYDNGFSTVCTTNDFCETDCVWPGDANSDGIVNHCDLFPIGLAFSENETNRFAPIYWAPFNSDPWTNSLWDGTNHKHADCNGDGIVDEKDQDLISQFYLQTHGNYVESPDEYQEGPELYFDIESVIGNLVGPGSLIVARLKSNIPEPMYGISFEIEYDWSFLAETTSILGVQDFWESSDPQFPILNSFIVTPNNQSQIYTSVRTDGQDSLSIPDQTLATFFLRIKTSNLPTGELCGPSMIRLKNIKAIKADGSPVSLGGTDFTIPLIYCGITSLSAQNESPISIHPNPTTDQVWINWNEYEAERLEILDITGKVLSRHLANADQNEISLAAFAKGIYFVRVIGQKGSPTFKIVKN